MPYTINRSDGTFLVTVNDTVTDTTATALSLPARGASNYGTAVAENFVYLLENFSSLTPPLRPMTGQIWFDKNINQLKFYTGASWNFIGADGFGVSLQTAPGPTLGGNTGLTNRISGSTGVPITLGNATTYVTVMTSEGKIIAVACSENIANSSLPTSITIESQVFAFKARFPNGISAGITLAFDAAGYTYAGSNQFSSTLLQVPYLLSGDDTGIVNAINVTVPSAISVYAEYFAVESKIAHTNTGPVTINVNGLGVTPVIRRSGSALIAGDLVAGMFYHFLYDGIRFVVTDASANGYVGPTGPAGVGATGPQGAAGATGATGGVGPTGPAGSNGTNGTDASSIGLNHWGVGAGTADAITVATLTPSLTADTIPDGACFGIYGAAVNTGAALTVRLPTLTTTITYPVLYSDGSTPLPGEVQLNQPFEVRKVGANLLFSGRPNVLRTQTQYIAGGFSYGLGNSVTTYVPWPNATGIHGVSTGTAFIFTRPGTYLVVAQVSLALLVNGPANIGFASSIYLNNTRIEVQNDDGYDANGLQSEIVSVTASITAGVGSVLCVGGMTYASAFFNSALASFLDVNITLIS